MDYLSLTHPGIGKYVLMMALQGLVYLVLVLMAELNVFNRILYFRKKEEHVHSAQVCNEEEDMVEEDDDVKKERERINDTDVSQIQQKDALILKNLSKNYGRFRAVRGVSIGIPQQECFGLLGQNGAGKTTTFKMMTGDENVTGGNAFLNKYDVKNHIKQVNMNVTLINLSRCSLSEIREFEMI